MSGGAGDVLREAAGLMRERAEAATPGGPRWETGPDEMQGPSSLIVFPADSDSAVAFAGADDAEHIASWHPAVALAVADWLTDIATRHSPSKEPLDLYLHYDSDEECETCEGGGHSSTVCDGCFPSYEGMDGQTVYPCAETRSATAVAAAYLGTAS